MKNINNRLSKEIKIINIEEIELEKTDTDKQLNTPGKEETGIIIYTSGTTGDPKGVMLTLDNLLANFESLEIDNMYSRTDKVLAILPFHHVLPLVGTVLLPMFLGSTTVITESLASQDILGAMQKNEVTILIGVPRIYKLFHQSIMNKINDSIITKAIFNITKLVKSESFRKKIFKKVHEKFGGNIKILVSGGAKLDPQIGHDFTTLGFKVTEGYGMTETAPMISYNKKDIIKIGTVGKPIHGTQVKTVEDEIWVKGRNVMKGYFNKPEETKKAITDDGWLKTGDLGTIDDEGFIHITGRKKEMIVLPSGKNIDPKKIEQKIINISPFIKEIGVIEKDNKLQALIYPDLQAFLNEGKTNIQETIKWNIINKYNQKAPGYKKILNFEIVNDELPKTRLGKLRRFKLESIIEDAKKETPLEKVPEPDSEYYRKLKKYISDNKEVTVLPDSHLELDLNFDSLDLVQLQVFIETAFDLSITQEDIFNNPTIKKLSEFIENKGGKLTNKKIDWSKILAEHSKGKLPKHSFIMSIIKFFSIPILKTYFRIEREGLENLPQDKSFIMVPNHQSFLDGFIISGSLKQSILKNTYFLSKSNYFQTSAMKYIANNANIITININKDIKETLRTLADVLKAKKNIVIFPEGTRTFDGSLSEFKKSFAILSKELDIPVVPTGIHGSHRAYPRGTIIPRPKKIKLKFFKPIYPENMDLNEIVSSTKNEIDNWVQEN